MGVFEPIEDGSVDGCQFNWDLPIAHEHWQATNKKETAKTTGTRPSSGLDVEVLQPIVLHGEAWVGEAQVNAFAP
jgi:hypothetical protein